MEFFMYCEAVAAGECYGSGRPSNDYPAWETIYGYFNRWSKGFVWEKINVVLVKEVRKRTKKPHKNKKYRRKRPSAGSIGLPKCKDYSGRRRRARVRCGEMYKSGAARAAENGLF